VPRFKYVCPECGNEVPAERIEKRVPGTRAQCRVILPVMCEGKGHEGGGDREMVRESYVPPRREVRD
jgi:hypothetical protein